MYLFFTTKTNDSGCIRGIQKYFCKQKVKFCLYNNLIEIEHTALGNKRTIIFHGLKNNNVQLYSNDVSLHFPEIKAIAELAVFCVF